MATSSRYTNLVNRIQQIETHLLPPISTAGYTPQDQDLIRSYCLLCHAEIESYFEDIIKSVCDNVVSTWKTDESVITPIIFHLAYTLKMSTDRGNASPYDMVKHAHANLNKVISGNNGIKENNMQLMLKPIGYQVDGVLQTALNELGKKRGQIAHSSFTTHTLLDPLTEKANLTQILKEIENFDLDLDRYANTGKSNIIPDLHFGKLPFRKRLKILFTGKL